jgi:flagellar biosynthesis anti-sigma factor FlgM
MVDPVNLGPARPVQMRLEQSADAPAKSTRNASTAHVAGPTLPKLLSLVAELASQEPPIDTAKIQQIRQMISAGSYTLNSDAIAGAMIGYFGKPSA